MVSVRKTCNQRCWCPVQAILGCATGAVLTLAERPRAASTSSGISRYAAQADASLDDPSIG